MTAKKRYGWVKSVPVYIMDKATQKEQKNYNQEILVIQSLLTGDTVIIKKERVTNISSEYPKRLK